MDQESRLHALAEMDDRIFRHQADLLGFLRRRCGGEAEELAQETWLRVARAGVHFPDDSAFRAYAFTVARRLLIDSYRRRASRIQLVPLEGGVEPSTSTDPHHFAVAGQALAVVERELTRIKPEVAEVFRLRTTSELSFKEIAAKQGVSINTALGRMHYATRHLQRALREAGLIRSEG